MAFRPHGEWFLADDAPGLADSPIQILCFAHAGGDPVGFMRWQHLLGDTAQLLAVVPPSRGHRGGQPAITDISTLAAAAAAAVRSASTRRTILFGHSLGALVAFEVARRLADLPAVTDLVASGCSAPSRMPSARAVAASKLQGREFAEAVAFFGGLPPDVLAAEELYDLLLPRLTADFVMVAGYRYRPGPVLQLSVQLINGEDDPHVQGVALDAWDAECAVSPRRHNSPGGHFYFEQHPDAVVAVLKEACLSGAQSAQYVELI